GMFDMVFFADLNYISDTYRGSLDPALRYAAQAPEHDPIPLLSYMAAVTQHIGVASTFSVSQHHPFYAARLWATIDHLTDGRAGWNVVTSINHNQDANFGVDRPPADLRYDRAHEFIEVPQAVGELGRGRRGDGPRKGPVRRLQQDSPHRAQGRILQVARAAQRRALAAGRAGDPAGRHLAQGRRLRRQVCRRDLRHPAAAAGRQALLRHYQGPHGRAGPAAGALPHPVRHAA